MDTEKFEPINGQTKDNKLSKVMIITVIAIVLILAVAGIVMAGNSNSKAIFGKQIDKILTYEETENYDTAKFNMDFEMKVEGEGEDTKEIANLMNDAKFSFNMEVDANSQEQLYGIKLEKAEEELLNAKVKLNVESKKAYLDLGQFFNKVIELDASEILEGDAEIGGAQSLTFTQLLSAKKAESILRKEVKEQLSEEYFSSEKVTVDNQKLTKNSLKMSGKEFKKVFEKICTNLSENEEFINCFKDSQEVKESLKEINYVIEDSEISDEMEFEIDLYTKGIFKTIERIDIIIIEEGDKIAIEITKKAEEEFTYKLLEDDEDIAEGTIKIHETNNQINVETTAEADETKVTVKASVAKSYNEQLTDLNTNDAVKAEELSTADVMALYGNFMGSKLYTIMEEMFSDTTNELTYDSNDDFELETPEASQPESSSLANNMLRTYNDQNIEIFIPDGYKMNTSDEYYKLLTKEVNDDSIGVDISISYSTKDEYLDEIKDYVKYYEEDEDYRNVKLSEVEEIEANGNKFYKYVISYEYELWEDEIQKYEDAFLFSEIDSKNLYTVEIENINLMDDQDLQQFLAFKK